MNTPTSNTEIVLAVRDKRRVSWMGIGSTVSDAFGAFKRAVAAADTANGS